MPVKPKILNWADCDWKSSREKCRGKCFQAENSTIVIGEITPGHKPGPHKHEYEQTVLILGGECDFYVDGVPYHLTQGCVMYIPPNTEHYIVAKGDGPCYDLDFFTPRRSDRFESIPNKPFEG